MHIIRFGLLIIVLLFGICPAVPGLSASNALAYRGRILEGEEFPSALLGRQVDFSLYLPPDYGHSSRRYPVVYLLHGFTDDESAWIQFGEIDRAVDDAISSRDVPPMIIVMPDGGVTWYINDYRNRVPYERMFVEELIPYIDSTYRTRVGKEFRGVSGLSMGGYGSLMLAMRHPDLFVACAAYSSGIHTDDEIVRMTDERYERIFGDLFGQHLHGSERLSEHYRAYNPLDLGKSLPVEELTKVRWYVDCGDDDFLYRGNAALHLLLRERKVPHEYRVRDGAHQWIYWRTWIVEGLRFIGQSFHR